MLSSRNNLVATSHRQSPGILLAMVLAAFATMALALFIAWALNPARLVRDFPAPGAESGMASSQTRPRGVVAIISSGAVRVERSLPKVDFALQEGQSADERLQPGPFRAEFTAPFETGATPKAQIGAEFQGGKLMIVHRGQPIVSDFAGDETRTALTTWPINLRREQDEITIVFQNDGKRPCLLRMLWQPEDEDAPRPLPVISTMP